MASSYAYGKNTVKALLEAHPSRVFKIFLSDTLKPDKRVDAIYELAGRHGISIQKVPRQKLDQLSREVETDTPDSTGPAVHQGVIASVAPKQLLSLHELIAKCKPRQEAGQFPRLLMLDGVSDPRNFGAILRVCDAAGVDGVIVPKHKSAGFGPAVAKTASGAEETVDVCVVSNLVNAIKELKDNGFWVVATMNAPDAVDYHKQDYKMSTVLVMGSEGEGVGQLVQKHCDFKVKIPMHGTVDSLNVSAATAVVLFEMVKA